MENVEKFKKTNEGLQDQLNGLSNKLQTKGDLTDGIFQKIA